MSSFSFSSVQSAGVTGFASNQIATVVLVVDDPAVTTGTISLVTSGLNFVPVITGNSVNALTNFGGTAFVSEMEPCTVTGQNPCLPANLVDTVTTFTQNGTTGYTEVYNLGNGTGNNRWMGGSLTFTPLFDFSAKSMVLDVTKGAAA